MGDLDPNTRDEIKITNIYPDEVAVVVTETGDVKIMLPWDTSESPSIIIYKQWEDEVGRIYRISIEPPLGMASSVDISVGDKNNIPPLGREVGGLPSRAEEAKEGFEDSEVSVSPLILDLDGDGIELHALGSAGSVFWDLDNDYFAEASGWVSGDDGLLALDRNGDGVINRHEELFGTLDTDGFSHLALLDSNRDRVIDSNDERFGDLLVWRDLNNDGASQAHELFRLADLNIVSIGLENTRVSIENAGNTITNVGAFTYGDGTTGEIVDAWFAYDPMNTLYNKSFTLDIRALFLPSVRGYGQLPDLHIAMSLDSGEGGLLERVEALAVQDMETLLSTPFATVKEDIYAIMYRWAGVDALDPASRGRYADARQLVYLEKMVGRDYLWMGHDPNPYSQAGKDIARTFLEDAIFLGARLAAQGAARALFAGDLSYDLNADAFRDAGALNTQTLAQLTALAQRPEVDALDVWANVLMIVTGVRGSFENLGAADQSALEAAITASDPALTFIGVNNYLYGHVPGLSSAPSTWGDDILTGTEGDDRIDGDAGNDLIYGYGGDDRLLGNTGNDTLYGGDGDDVLDGARGDDHFYGGPGADLQIGGLGSDTYYYNMGDGDDSIVEDVQGQGATDKIVFGEGISLDDLTFTRLNNLQLGIFISDAAGGGSIILERQFDVSPRKVEEIHFYDGSVFNPDSLSYTLHGSDLPETLRGVQNGAQEDDTIFGHGGNDIIIGYFGADSLYGGPGDDTIYALDPYSFHLDTNTHILMGDEGNDFIKGSGGVDHITGGPGDDSLRGEYGEDHYYYNLGDGHDSIVDNGLPGETDRLRLGDSISLDMLAYSIDPEGNDLTILINGGSDGSITILSQYRSASSHFRVEEAILSDGTVLDLVFQDYTWSGTDDGERLWGRRHITGGNDTIYGLGGDDAINGFSGDDTLYGGRGNDALYGGDGDDWLDGGQGADRMEGGAGDDTYVVNHPGDEVIERPHENVDLVRSSITYALPRYVENLTLTGARNIDGTGNALANVIRGNAGDNTLTGGDGDDLLNGGSGADRMEGGAGNDTYVVDNQGDRVVERADQGVDLVRSSIAYTLPGHVENLTLTGSGDIAGFGNALANVIRGNAGDNILRGRGGDDRLFGGAGDDTLVGGPGQDWLSGGAGADVFVFASAADAGLGESRDVISDFGRGPDKIDLRRIDADTSRDGNQAFTYISDDEFRGEAGQLRFDLGVLIGDTDGDGLADFEIALRGVERLPADNILL